MGEVRPAKALLIDFGGVLTSSVFESFRAYMDNVGVDPRLVEKLLREDEASSRALVAHESGNAPLEEFERIFAGRLRAHGANVEDEGLVARLTSNLRPDRTMIAAVERIKEQGFPTVLVSNSLGYEAYEGYGLEELLDHLVVSGRVGVRKPSRRIYELGAEAAGVPLEDCVMVDDLRQNIEAAGKIGMQGVLHRRPTDSLPLLGEMFDIDFKDLLVACEVSARIEEGGAHE
jgi:putative hydrolase of the HAD superfamily